LWLEKRKCREKREKKSEGEIEETNTQKGGPCVETRKTKQETRLLKTAEGEKNKKNRGKANHVAKNERIRIKKCGGDKWEQNLAHQLNDVGKKTSQ